MTSALWGLHSRVEKMKGLMKTHCPLWGGKGGPEASAEHGGGGLDHAPAPERVQLRNPRFPGGSWGGGAWREEQAQGVQKET